MRDPVKWFHSVRDTIREIIRFRQTLAFLPLRLLQTILGSLPTNVSNWSCFSATYLGPRYPRGLFGAIDSGEETAVRFFTDWNDQVSIDHTYAIKNQRKAINSPSGELWVPLAVSL